MFQPSFDSNAIQREIQAMEAIGDHDNIVKLFEVDEEVCALALHPGMACVHYTM